MNKMLVASLLAVLGIALSQQQACAWTNGKFSVGLNWEYSSGGNTFLWGAFKNGQVPGPAPYYGGMPYGAPYGGQEFPMMGPAFTAPAPQSAPPAKTPPAPSGAQETMPAPAVTGYMPYYGSPYQYVNYNHYYYSQPYVWYGR